tara:strand:- start:65 stop:718 length:654 start_codon:yes stop_codon:yes gene_type:complete
MNQTKINLVSPYRNITQSTIIKILPHHMNSDIRNNMKLNLKKKVEKRCNKNGFIDEVHEITEYNNGIIPSENLSGAAFYNVSYNCRICIPIENSIIIAETKIINSELVMAKNGPIYIFIPKENISSNIWNIGQNFMNKNSKKKLKENNLVKIKILNKRINKNDFQIKCIGKLLDFASDEEINKYYGLIENVEEKNILEEKNDSDIDDLSDKMNNFII